MNRTPILNSSVREQIVSHLRTEVLTGQLSGGERLREQHLAERLGVSRGPIRDALLQLTNEGLLVAQQNRGVHVRETPGAAIRPLVVNLRRQLEVFALESIITDVTAHDLEFWRANLHSFHAACKRQEMSGIVEHDIAFHRSIIERVGDDGLTAMWLPVVTQMMLPYSRHKNLLESYREHRNILHAIEAGDRALAVEYLQQNIQ
jgi:DNA-binding GntR family transcriptional regulator